MPIRMGSNSSLSIAAITPDAEKALQVAEINVNHYGLHDRIELIQSDLFDRLKGNASPRKAYCIHHKV